MSVAEPNPPAPTTAPPASTKHPKGLYFFFWGEFAERCSYYGMRAILTLYLTTRLGMPDDKASAWYFAFKMACYFLPLLGGWLADRYLGKYWTIVGFSVPYVVGQLLIGVEFEWTVAIALALCAMGSGVIKPNISALLGQTYDQQRPGDTQLRGNAFLWFYFAVNVGATISLLALPFVRDKAGYQVAFLVPAALMAMALAIFALGKKTYAVEKIEPPKRKTPEERAAQWKTLSGLFGVFGLMIFYWIVYEHNDVQWTFFARDHINRWMPKSLPGWLLGGYHLAADQFQFVNGLAVLVLIVVFQWFFKIVDPTGKKIPQTSKILVGFLFVATGPGLLALAAQQATAATPAVTAAAEQAAGSAVENAPELSALASPTIVVGAAAEYDGDQQKVSMWWIVVAYILLTIGEVLVYGTMLDLSYAYAPPQMKGLITACFLVTNALGNLINMQYARLYGKTFSPEAFFGIDAGLCVFAAVLFFFVARQFNKNAAKSA